MYFRYEFLSRYDILFFTYTEHSCPLACEIAVSEAATGEHAFQERHIGGLSVKGFSQFMNSRSRIFGALHPSLYLE